MPGLAGSRAVSRDAALRIALIMCGLAAALGLRLSIGGADAASYIPAALAFGLSTLGISVAAGWRPGPISARAVALGGGGGALLVAVWLVSRPAGASLHAAAPGALILWTPVMALVALAEETLLRGALFAALSDRRGELTALAVTSVVFAVLHLPLYGIEALPVDFAVGVLLGGLRMWSGGVGAPAVAHVIADSAGGWLV